MELQKILLNLIKEVKQTLESIIAAEKEVIFKEHKNKEQLLEPKEKIQEIFFKSHFLKMAYIKLLTQSTLSLALPFANYRNITLNHRICNSEAKEKFLLYQS